MLAVYGLLLGLIRSRYRLDRPGRIAHALNNSVAIALALAVT